MLRLAAALATTGALAVGVPTAADAIDGNHRQQLKSTGHVQVVRDIQRGAVTAVTPRDPGSIVRVDLVSLSPTERDANNAPKRVLRQRLIFSVEAFANSVDVMQNALQGLVDAGVVRRNQPRTSSAEAPNLAFQSDRASPPSSPPRPAQSQE